MKLRAASLVVLILSFLFVDASLSFSFRPISALKPPSWLKRIIPKVRDMLKSLIHGPLRLVIGDIFFGLSTIKDYLDLFGYLDSTFDSNNTFTLSLELAIKHYQKNFNLNITGQLDVNTTIHMSLPRCGVADVINGSTTMNSGKENNSTTPFKKWWPESKMELTYAFSFETDAVVEAGAKGVFVKAFGRWSEATMLNFTETTSFNESDIRISFLSLDGKLGVVAGASANYTTKSAELLLDFEENWGLSSENTAGERDSLDLESVVMHQIGHVLGLGHSSIEESIMYPSILPWLKRKVELAKDDVETIQQLYGTNSSTYGELSPTPSPSPSQSPSGVAGEDSGVAVVRRSWGLVPTLWLGFVFLVVLN